MSAWFFVKKGLAEFVGNEKAHPSFLRSRELLDVNRRAARSLRPRELWQDFR